MGIATTKERWLILAQEYQNKINENKPWIKVDLDSYQGTKNNLKYYCERHNFHGEASAAALKKSKGCPSCQKEDHLYNTPEYIELVREREAVKFIEKAVKVHGDKYTYNIDWYSSRNDTLTKIFCNKHQEFFYQRPAAHLQGQNCPECGRESNRKNSTLDSDEVLFRIKSFVQNPNISYDSFRYEGQHSKAVFTCKLHGNFTKIVNNIGNGHPLLCPTCVKQHNRLLEENKFISDAKTIHGDKYDYSLVVGKYDKNNSKVPVICNIHNSVFYTSRNKHVDSKRGCPECAKLLLGRWDVKALKKNINYHANKPCCTYLLKIEHNGVIFYKLGITTDIKIRIRLILDELVDARIDILQESWSNTIECVILEKYLLSLVKDNRYKHLVRFGGYTECFIPSNEQLLILSTILSSPT